VINPNNWSVARIASRSARRRSDLGFIDGHSTTTTGVVQVRALLAENRHPAAAAPYRFRGKKGRLVRTEPLGGMLNHYSRRAA
jgi:hypothetical protein